MKKALLAVMMFGMVSVANAGVGTFISGAHPVIWAATLIGAAEIMLHDEVQACDKEPIRKVSWKNNPGYSFTVAGCDFQAKKDKLVVR